MLPNWFEAKSVHFRRRLPPKSSVHIMQLPEGGSDEIRFRDVGVKDVGNLGGHC